MSLVGDLFVFVVIPKVVNGAGVSNGANTFAESGGEVFINEYAEVENAIAGREFIGNWNQAFIYDVQVSGVSQGFAVFFGSKDSAKGKITVEHCF